MEQQIRYCTSADGTDIAYATAGSGIPLLFVPTWCGNVEFEWKHPRYCSFRESLTQKCLLVQWDRRGVGLSQRNVDDLSLEAHIADITAVADDLHMERFSLFGCHDAAAIATAFAAQHPERVSRLVLWASYSHGEELGPPDQVLGLVELIRKNWSLAPQAIADFTFPTGPIEEQRLWARQIRQSVSPDIAAKYWESFILINIRPYLAHVKAPTLVLHRRHDRSVSVSVGQRIAALIPDARFIELEGDMTVPYTGDISYLETVMQFLEGHDVSSSKSVPTSSASMIGKTISHYKVLEKLGEGGMGVVYKAEDTKLKRTVALKFLPAEMTRSQEWEERFLREAQAAAALDHQSICHTYEIDEADGQTFISMAYIDGQSLEERIGRGGFEPDEALDIAIQIAEGLREAHDCGVVHRDIKSANILVGRRDQAKILDFGLAKLTEQSRLTKTATIMGTASYMSPEQARGDATIDHRTDIWSLGVVLYEMLTGKLPFIASTDAGLLYRIIHEEPEPLSSIRTNIPIALEQAVKKAMQKNPQDRYEDMEALISDLKSIQSGAAPVIDLEDKTTPSIAVLSFVDMSPAKDQEYFCDGISESIINELTQLSDLRVIARTSAFSFKGQNLDVREIGKKLNVGTVLEGSIQKAGDRVRVTAQLVNTIRGEHLWSEKYDRDLQDIFAIQDEISEAIVRKLKSQLLDGEKIELAKRQTVDPETYSLYLKGRWFLNKRTEEGMKKGFEHLTEAIEKDPNYAPAHAGLADFYIILGFYGVLSPHMAFPNAKKEALRALEIDDTLGEAHASLGHIMALYEWDWEEAEREYRRAIELNPGYVTAHVWYSLYLMGVARIDEAIEEVHQALERDPLSLLVNWFVGIVLHMAQRYDQAAEALSKTIELDPGFPGPHLLLGMTYLKKELYDEALKMLQKEKAILKGSNPLIESYIGVTLARLGREDEALEILKDFQQRLEEVYVPPSSLAGLYLALGDNDKGFEWLERGCEEHDFLLFLRVDPSFENVHSDPRFKAVLKKMNLEL